MKAIVVDDDKTMRTVLVSLFESEGHTVVAALEDGASLMALVKADPPDMICLDYHLPGRNGLELLGDIHRIAPDIDVLLVTGSDDPALHGKAADAGASGFLHKPFSQPQILKEIRDVAKNREIVGETRASETATPPAPAAETAAAGAMRPRTAVVVDDNGSIRLLIKGLLEGLGIKVVQQASDGAAGVEAAKRHYPQLVCLDVDMPQMTGLEALPLIRSACPQSIVVMVTGNADRKFVETAAANGARGYVLKPVRPAHIETVILKLLGVKPAP